MSKKLRIKRTYSKITKKCEKLFIFVPSSWKLEEILPKKKTYTIFVMSYFFMWNTVRMFTLSLTLWELKHLKLKAEFVQTNTLSSACSRNRHTRVKRNYYSLKIFPQLWLAKSTRINHHNQLLMTKFGRILCLSRKWHQKCSPLQVKAPLPRRTGDEVELFWLWKQKWRTLQSFQKWDNYSWN